MCVVHKRSNGVITPPRVVYGGWRPILPGDPYYFGPKFVGHHQPYAEESHQLIQQSHQVVPVVEQTLRTQYTLMPESALPDKSKKDVFAYYPPPAANENHDGYKPLYVELARKPFEIFENPTARPPSSVSHVPHKYADLLVKGDEAIGENQIYEQTFLKITPLIDEKGNPTDEQNARVKPYIIPIPSDAASFATGHSARPQLPVANIQPQHNQNYITNVQFVDQNRNPAHGSLISYDNSGTNHNHLQVHHRNGNTYQSNTLPNGVAQSYSQPVDQNQYAHHASGFPSQLRAAKNYIPVSHAQVYQAHSIPSTQKVIYNAPQPVYQIPNGKPYHYGYFDPKQYLNIAKPNFQGRNTAPYNQYYNPVHFPNVPNSAHTNAGLTFHSKFPYNPKWGPEYRKQVPQQKSQSQGYTIIHIPVAGDYVRVNSDLHETKQESVLLSTDTNHRLLNNNPSNDTRNQVSFLASKSYSNRNETNDNPRQERYVYHNSAERTNTNKISSNDGNTAGGDSPNQEVFHAYYAPVDHQPPEGYVRMSVKEFNKMFKNAEIRYVDKEPAVLESSHNER